MTQPHAKQKASRVLPWLWVGERGAAEDAEFLRAHAIGAVLSLCPASCAAVQRKLLDVPDSADYDLGQYFGECAAWLEAQRCSGRAALVHCRLGHSRSTTIVLAYLLLQAGWTLRDAYAHLLRCHAPTSPNVGFFAQLQLLEARLQPATAAPQQPLAQPLRRTRSYARRTG